MVKFNSILIILLALAVGYLLFDKFSGPMTAEAATESTEASDTLPFEGSIAYINIDTLNAHYDLLDDNMAKIDQEQQRAKRRIATKMDKAQATAQKLQESITQYSTENDYMAAQQKLQDLEMGVKQFNEQVSNELMNMEIMMQTEMYNRIHGYMEEFNKEKGYDYIFGYQQGGQILYGKDALDVTQQAITDLNARYAEELAAKEVVTED